jgi:hypothetical protein
MYKKAFSSTTLLLLVVLAFGFTSCKKGCVIEKKDTDTGLIVVDASVFALSGGLTSSMNGDYFVHGNSAFAGYFEMSLDGGVTRGPVDFSSYTILACPMSVSSCEVAFERTVTRNDVLGTATYTINAYVCKDSKCDEDRFVENFIVVPAIPETYTIFYNCQVIEG